MKLLWEAIQVKKELELEPDVALAADALPRCLLAWRLRLL
jgi:hypothetical protein